jgi:hypothetical protein
MQKFLKFILGMKLYMFRTVSLSIIRSFSLYTQQWYMSYRFADSLWAGSGWNCSSIPILANLGKYASRIWLQGSVHSVHVKWPNFLMINAVEEGNLDCDVITVLN